MGHHQGRGVSGHRAAIRELLNPFATRETQIRALGDALGLALAQDLVAPVSLPPFDNSQMDGFAVRTADFDAANLRVPMPDGARLAEFAIAAPIAAGAVPAPLGPREAAPIMTGAMMPEGADAVVPVERAVPPRFPELTFVAVDHARVSLPIVEPGTFVRRTGSDVEVRSVVIAAGTCLGPAHLGLAAGLGFAEVPVRAPLRVAVVSTGAELAEPGADLRAGQIHDANGTLLTASLHDAGIDARATAVRSDEPSELLTALDDAANWADLILTTGGVSHGAFEATKLALSGEDVEFVHLAMQPGGPQGIGMVRGIPFLGFPGNPVSCWVSWEVLLRPVLSELTGVPTPRRRVKLPLAESLDSPAGKLQVRRARVEGDAVVLVGGPGSHLLGALANSDALVMVPEDVTSLSAGTNVEVWLL